MRGALRGDSQTPALPPDRHVIVVNLQRYRTGAGHAPDAAGVGPGDLDGGETLCLGPHGIPVGGGLAAGKERYLTVASPQVDKAVLRVVPLGRCTQRRPRGLLVHLQTRALAVRACYDCHSNETVWPWYSQIAPASWLVQTHVEQGRRKLNLSEWNRPQEGAEAVEAAQEGEMPPRSYVWAHPKAWLSPSEHQALVRGLMATFGREPAREAGAGEKEAEEGEREH
jgi:hypothetical protein